MKPDIIIAFCDAIFKRCPWAAPASWHLRQTFKNFTSTDEIQEQ